MCLQAWPKGPTNSDETLVYLIKTAVSFDIFFLLLDNCTVAKLIAHPTFQRYLIKAAVPTVSSAVDDQYCPAVVAPLSLGEFADARWGAVTTVGLLLPVMRRHEAPHSPPGHCSVSLDLSYQRYLTTYGILQRILSTKS